MSDVTKPWTVTNFGNILAMMILFFFSKCSKFDGDSIKGLKIQKMFFAFKKTGFAEGTANYDNP